MEFALKIIQMVLSVILITLVLLQNRGSGLGGIFGGEGNVYRTKRGFDKFLFIGTIITAALFLGVALFNFIY
ncbi:MAG: preprotein translocase subunit SecG [Patescibacteria group bacterium]|nr:preprotein translocase subunit SecG [Patescibacteria group bacterium]